MPATTRDQWEKWFEAVWAEREDVIYRRLFGDIGQRIASIPPALFETLGVAAHDIDPRWPTHGVFTSPPQPSRPNWLYVTSALSNPWGLDPADADRRRPSGLGIELIFQTPEPAPWAVPVLHWLMAVQILAASGFLQGDTVQAGDLVPLNRPLDPAIPASQLRNLFISPPPQGIPPRFELPSGTVDLLLCVGITDSEMAFAREKGSGALLQVLRQHAAWPTTDPTRGPLLTT